MHSWNRAHLPPRCLRCPSTRAEPATATRRRLDVELVRRGLTLSLEQAQRAIESGQVLVGGAPATGPSRLVTAAEAVALSAPPSRFVGRGGEKLASALDRFAVDLRGARVLDAGASTGGFTDCALQAGAEQVVAVDVGRGQLHQRLRTDPRVVVLERTNVRLLTVQGLGGMVDAVVADLSFISLRSVAPVLLALAAPAADLVWLVKPQFEATRAEAGRHRGVIVDPQVWSRVLTDVLGTLEGLGAANIGLMSSPLRGADGNVEFLVHAVNRAVPPVGVPVARLVADALAEVRAQ